MASYLDQYGAGEERRESIAKWLIGSALFLLIFGALGYYLFKNHSQERSVKHFLAMVRAKDYRNAYATWGCSDSKPCPGYTYDKFLEDWGPKAASDSVRISDSETCNAGVIVTVIKDSDGANQEKLWVEKNSPTIGFSPFPSCPNKTPLANMIHQTVGKLKKPFLN